jgi:EmrB/QacA subfamily drug resistance transporter
MTAAASPTPVSVAAAAGGARRWVILTLLAVAQLMLVLDVTVVNVALPDIGSALRLGREAVPWVMTTYTLPFGGLMLLGGRIGDLLGARRVMLTGLVVFTVSSLLCALAGSAGVLLAGRAAQGVGAALLSPAALALLMSTFTGPERGKALGVWAALSGVGTALGVILGGVLTSSVGWRWIFAINVPIGATILVALPLLVPPARVVDARARLDVPGALLVTAGTGAMIYGLINAGSHGWGAPSTLVPLAAASAFWVLFAVAERSAPDPLLRVRLLRHRPVAAGAYLMLIATGLLVGGFFLGSFALQREHGYSAVHVGVSFLPIAVAIIAGARTAGLLLTHVSPRAVAASGLALAAAGDATAALWSGPAGLVLGLAVAALGIGATFVTAFTASLADVNPAQAGLRSAIVSTFHELGGALGVAVLSSLAGADLTATHLGPHGFTRAFGAAALAAAASVAVAAVLVPAVTRPAGRTTAAH